MRLTDVCAQRPDTAFSFVPPEAGMGETRYLLVKWTNQTGQTFQPTNFVAAISRDEPTYVEPRFANFYGEWYRAPYQETYGIAQSENRIGILHPYDAGCGGGGISLISEWAPAGEGYRLVQIYNIGIATSAGVVIGSLHVLDDERALLFGALFAPRD
ncbi:MAG: hypothetical protein AAF998_11140 [Bacteroidota bacterium]